MFTGSTKKHILIILLLGVIFSSALDSYAENTPKILMEHVHGFIREAKTFWKEVDRENLKKGDLLRFDGGIITPAPITNGAGKYKLLGASPRSLVFSYSGGDIHISAKPFYSKGMLIGIQYYLNGKPRGLAAFSAILFQDETIEAEKINSLCLAFETLEAEKIIRKFPSLKYLIVDEKVRYNRIELNEVITRLDYISYISSEFTFSSEEDLKLIRKLKFASVILDAPLLRHLFQKSTRLDTLLLSLVGRIANSEMALALRNIPNLSITTSDWELFQWLCDPIETSTVTKNLSLFITEWIDAEKGVCFRLARYPNLESLSATHSNPIHFDDSFPSFEVYDTFDATNLHTVDLRYWQLPFQIIAPSTRRLYLTACVLDGSIRVPKKSTFKTCYLTKLGRDQFKLYSLLYDQAKILVLNKTFCPIYGSATIKTICSDRTYISARQKYIALKQVVLWEREVPPNHLNMFDWSEIDKNPNLDFLVYSVSRYVGRQIPDNIAFLDATKNNKFSQIAEENYPLVGFYDD